MRLEILKIPVLLRGNNVLERLIMYWIRKKHSAVGLGAETRILRVLKSTVQLKALLENMKCVYNDLVESGCCNSCVHCVNVISHISTSFRATTFYLFFPVCFEN